MNNKIINLKDFVENNSFLQQSDKDKIKYEMTLTKRMSEVEKRLSLLEDDMSKVKQKIGI